MVSQCRHLSKLKIYKYLRHFASICAKDQVKDHLQLAPKFMYLINIAQEVLCIQWFTPPPHPTPKKRTIFTTSRAMSNFLFCVPAYGIKSLPRDIMEALAVTASFCAGNGRLFATIGPCLSVGSNWLLWLAGERVGHRSTA
jgi:hypothetical protein